MSDHDALLVELDEAAGRQTVTSRAARAAAAIRELESALASERANRVEADDENRHWRVQSGLAREVLRYSADRLDEHTYSEFSSVLDDAWTVEDGRDLATAALARHDAEVAARALEEAADWRVEHDEDHEFWMKMSEQYVPGQVLTANWLRARAAEKRAS